MSLLNQLARSNKLNILMINNVFAFLEGLVESQSLDSTEHHVRKQSADSESTWQRVQQINWLSGCSVLREVLTELIDEDLIQ